MNIFKGIVIILVVILIGGFFYFAVTNLSPALKQQETKKTINTVNDVKKETALESARGLFQQIEYYYLTTIAIENKNQKEIKGEILDILSNTGNVTGGTYSIIMNDNDDLDIKIIDVIINGYTCNGTDVTDIVCK